MSPTGCLIMTHSPASALKTVAGVSEKKGGTQKPKPNPKSILYEGWQNSPSLAFQTAAGVSPAS